LTNEKSLMESCTSITLMETLRTSSNSFLFDPNLLEHKALTTWWRTSNPRCLSTIEELFWMTCTKKGIKFDLRQ
jgi:hypothetical protein